jgi:hypothetical protein
MHLHSLAEDHLSNSGVKSVGAAVADFLRPDRSHLKRLAPLAANHQRERYAEGANFEYRKSLGTPRTGRHLQKALSQLRCAPENRA